MGSVAALNCSILQLILKVRSVLTKKKEKLIESFLYSPWSYSEKKNSHSLLMRGTLVDIVSPLYIGKSRVNMQIYLIYGLS